MRRGSAIILAMFIITAIGTAAFSVGRLMYLEVASARAYERGINAYYAAESGLEEAFLRYRYNHNTQVPLGGEGMDSDRVLRSDLTQNILLSDVNSGLSQSGTGITNQNNQIYDLSLTSKVTQIGNSDLASVAAGANNHIPRDEAKKYWLGNLTTGQDIHLTFLSLGNPAASPSVLAKLECTLLEVKIIGRASAASPLEEHKRMFRNSATATCDYAGILDTMDPQENYVLDPSNKVSINQLKTVVWGSTNLYDGELFLKPIGADIAFSLLPAGTSSIFAPTTEVTSWGYFGNVSRKLAAEIDHQSGSVYDLFDYVAFQME